MKINPIKRITICDQIVEQIKELIEDGELKVGDKLPAERELSKLFDVGRPSIREAIISLASQGIVYKTQEGTFVNDRLGNNYINIINKQYLNDSDYIDLYEARKLIEMSTTGLAAKNVEEDDIKGLEEIIEEMKQAAYNDIEEFTRLDADFHQSIALASKNKILYIIISDILDLLKDQIEENTARMLQRKDINIYDETLHAHNNILLSIKNGDTIKASDYIFKHLDRQIQYRNTIDNNENLD